MFLKKYPKFKEDKDCAYPERDNCNWDDDVGSKRCEYMKCISCGNWHCIYKKQVNDKQINNTNKGNI